MSKDNILFLVTGILAASLIWSLTRKVQTDDTTVKNTITTLQQEKEFYQKENDSLYKVISNLIDKQKALTNQNESNTIKWEQIRSNPINDVVADSMRSAIIRKGRERYN